MLAHAGSHLLCNPWAVRITKTGPTPYVLRRPVRAGAASAAPASGFGARAAAVGRRQQRRTLGSRLVVRADRDFYQILGVSRDSGARLCQAAEAGWRQGPPVCRAPRFRSCAVLEGEAAPAMRSSPMHADKKTIKSAYRQLARKYHPDVNKEADAEERFKDISAAYEVRRHRQSGSAAHSGILRQARHPRPQPSTLSVSVFQVLSDDEKRGMYDRFGEQGLKGGFAGAGAGGMGGMGDFRCVATRVVWLRRLHGSQATKPSLCAITP